MLDNDIINAYCAILEEELVPAMGCTEPIAVAFAAAKARQVLGSMPTCAEVFCSANIVKNVKSVTVPNTGGMKGIEAAAIAGILANAAERELEVLQALRPEDRERIAALREEGFCAVHLAEGVEGLYIDLRVYAEGTAGATQGATNNPGTADDASAPPRWPQPQGRSARVVVRDTHTGICLIERDGVQVYPPPKGTALVPASEPSSAQSTAKPSTSQSSTAPDASLVRACRISPDRREYRMLRLRDIVEFAQTVPLDRVAGPLRRQIEMNSTIADEGLSHPWGVSVGKTLLAQRDSTDVRVRARARAAAGSDARMAGCALPVVINSGSGNQGLTVSLPVIEYARAQGASEERLIRALVISNLVALEQKEYIGKLSAYCGAVSAAVGASAAIAWLEGASYEQIAATVTNAIATADGILCDGAKPSCAAKIATALEAAILAKELALAEGRSFSPGEGLVGPDVDATIRNIGLVGSRGMRPTDAEIIRIMLGEQPRHDAQDICQDTRMEKR
jgi:L-cysteine desulfidase